MDAIVNSEDRPMRWNVRRRLERIELLLLWDGRVNRSDLTSFFGISEPQASADLTKYRDAAPDNVQYDPSAKCYVATDDFRPVFVKPNASRYLSQLRLIDADVIDRTEAWFNDVPEFDALGVLHGQIEAEILQGILKIMRRQQAIKIRYQSMSRPQPILRWISPHSLGFDGRRWHVRAYCHIREDFRDFSFARISEVGAAKATSVDPAQDVDWNTRVVVRLTAHPDLAPPQRKVIEFEYGMKRGELRLQVRRCMLFYLVNHLRLDPKKYRLSPEERQIHLINMDEILNLLKTKSLRPNTS